MFLSVFALLLITAFAWAKPPTLEPESDFPPSILPGHTYTFHLKYKQTEGDRPASLKMLIDAPSGQISVPAQIPGGDPISGIDVTWDFTPQDSGQYQYHFEATSSTGTFARYPAENKELEFESPSMAGKYIALAVGLLIGLLFLPFVVYVGTRSVNKRSDPAAAARIALLIGVIASYCLYLYLFAFNGLIINLLAGFAALAVLIVLFSRRRVA